MSTPLAHISATLPPRNLAGKSSLNFTSSVPSLHAQTYIFLYIGNGSPYTRFDARTFPPWNMEFPGQSHTATRCVCHQCSQRNFEQRLSLPEIFARSLDYGRTR